MREAVARFGYLAGDAVGHLGERVAAVFGLLGGAEHESVEPVPPDALDAELDRPQLLLDRKSVV